MFALVMIAGVGVGVYGLVKGDLSNIAQPFDIDKNACGKGSAANFPLLYFNEPDKTFTKSTICVSKCPEEASSPINCLPNTAFKE